MLAILRILLDQVYDEIRQVILLFLEWLLWRMIAVLVVLFVYWQRNRLFRILAKHGPRILHGIFASFPDFLTLAAEGLYARYISSRESTVGEAE